MVAVENRKSHGDVAGVANPRSSTHVRERFIIIKCINLSTHKNGVSAMKNVKGFAFVLFSVFLVVALSMAMAENNQTGNATMNKTANETLNKTVYNETLKNATMNQTTNETNSTTNPFKNAKGQPPCGTNNPDCR